jgi:hypothetical protein
MSDLPLFLPGDRESKRRWGQAWEVVKALIYAAAGAGAVLLFR